MSDACTFPVFAISTRIGIDSPTFAEVTSVDADFTTRSGALKLIVTIFSLESNESPTHDGVSSCLLLALHYPSLKQLSIQGYEWLILHLRQLQQSQPWYTFRMVPFQEAPSVDI